MECEVEVVADSTTAVLGKHFEIEKLVFPRGKVEGILSLQLKRTGDMMGNPVMIYLRFKENDCFTAMENEHYRLSVVDGVLVAPAWWACQLFLACMPIIIINFTGRFWNAIGNWKN